MWSYKVAANVCLVTITLMVFLPVLFKKTEDCTVVLC
jgi:hypothetical protein